VQVATVQFFIFIHPGTAAHPAHGNTEQVVNGRPVTQPQGKNMPGSGTIVFPYDKAVGQKIQYPGGKPLFFIFAA